MRSGATRKRSPKEKAKHAADERKRYATLKNGLINAITLYLRLDSPTCTMLTWWKGYEVTCGKAGPLEIDHRYGTTFKQRKVNSVQRLERFAIEFVRWVGGNDRCELRLACRSCNAKHQPKRKARR